MPLSAVHSRPPFRRAPRAGFALLLVVTLIAFLVILLVGLATYTRVETAVAGNTQRQAQARENALLALNVAVAHLQKYAGPDSRVTATAGSFSPGAGTARFTGVWPTYPAADPAADPDNDPLTPLTWLVSGNELADTDGAAAPLAVSPQSTLSGPTSVALVGVNTSGTANNVLARLVPLTAAGVPGVAPTATATIGRYAWWIGDNGVKADVARTDVTARLNYAPFVDAVGADVPEMRTRLLQQTGLGAGPFNTASGTVAFDPRDTANLTLAANTLAAQQIPFLRNPAGTALGLAQLKTHYHNWTVGNHAVLARTNAPAGESALRNDLSLNPAALGTAFTAWADYPSYMETPAADALRRRYKMTPAVSDPNGSQFGVAPVLSYFALAFSIRNNDESESKLTSLECSMRCVAEFWNPYTGALVPEDLEILVTGIPDVDVIDTQGLRRHLHPMELLGDTALPDNPIRFTLPWVSSGADDQHSSWLPGRVYNWSAASAPLNASGNSMDFDVRALQNGSGQGVLRDVAEPLNRSVGSSDIVMRQCFIRESTILTIELRRVADGTTLAKFQSPSFNAVPDGSTPIEVSKHALDFAFVFRLADPLVDGVAWLQTPGLDPRLTQPPVAPASHYIQPGNAADPALFVVGTDGSNVATFAAGNTSLLLDRYPGSSSSPAGTSVNEDVPVFELPRAPLLSLGQLQHLAIPTLQPFWIGNSAASTGPVEWSNTLFDQHFFSGLGSGTAWTDVTRPLPNTLARVLRHKPDGTALVATDLGADGLSAKFLLQGGAFNLNSTEPDAWAAVVRSVRFPVGREFKYLDADDTTGTNPDTVAPLLLTGEAVFPRFSQSAQETYKAAPDYQHQEPGADSGITLRTDYYRRGFRTLDAPTVTALAQNISAAVKARIATSGPFFSLEEFLNPAAGAGTPSLLEQAILDLNLNGVIAADDTPGMLPFSSSFLTQADIMTVLAPVLVVRSDTFTVRAYGEATNPVTGLTEGKAWCEAIVQRLPEPFSPATAGQPTDDEYKLPPGEYGRRFKIISLRWLTKSDI